MVYAGRGASLGRRRRRAWIGLAGAAVLISIAGCGIVPSSRMDECQRLSGLLRDENARLKDQVLSLRSQNRDLADRAVDDQRRISARDDTIEHLERSVQAYQSERERLAAAFDDLTTDLGRPSRDGARAIAHSGPSGKMEARPSPSEPPPANAGSSTADGMQVRQE